MTFIHTIGEHAATGATAELYAADRHTFGDLPNFTRAFGARPAVYAAWRALNGAIKREMDERRYELATLAAARRLRSSYCTLAHGSVLIDRFLDRDTVRALVADPATAGLNSTDTAIMNLADKIADDATTVEQTDIDRLRSLGLTDTDILDVVLAAAARSFFSKTLDALGVAPDAKYAALDPTLREALTVGRAIAQASAARPRMSPTHTGAAAQRPSAAGRPDHA
jgi:uncharacterized peroxidase-related enzyme